MECAACAHLRTPIRRAIITLSRIFYPLKSPPEIPPPETHPMTTAADPQIVPRQPAISALSCAPPTRAWPTPLESVLSDNTRRVYGTQWRLFNDWCDEVGSRVPARRAPHRGPLPGRPRRLRQPASPPSGWPRRAIAKAHEWAKLESPCRDPGVRASLKGWGRRLSKPQRQSGALTADVLAVIRLTAVQPRTARPRYSRRPSRLPRTREV